MDIAGKVFIVTGGASGLGEGTARMLAAQGGKVVVADLQAELGQKVADEIDGVFVKCDVSQESDGQAVVDAARAGDNLCLSFDDSGNRPRLRTLDPLKRTPA